MGLTRRCRNCPCADTNMKRLNACRLSSYRRCACALVCVREWMDWLSEWMKTSSHGTTPHQSACQRCPRSVTFPEFTELTNWMPLLCYTIKPIAVSFGVHWSISLTITDNEEYITTHIHDTRQPFVRRHAYKWISELFSILRVIPVFFCLFLSWPCVSYWRAVTQWHFRTPKLPTLKNSHS